MMNIIVVKGAGIFDGFSIVEQKGTDHRDEIYHSSLFYRLRRFSLYLILTAATYASCNSTDLNSTYINNSGSLMPPTSVGVIKSVATTLLSSFFTSDTNLTNMQSSLANTIDSTKTVAMIYQMSSSSAAVIQQGFGYCVDALVNLTTVCPAYVDQYCIGNSQARNNDTSDEGCGPTVPLGVIIFLSAAAGGIIGLVCGACGVPLWKIWQADKQAQNIATPANPEDIALNVLREDEVPVRPEE